METKKEIRNYCKNKLNALVRDHNHYNKVKYKDAVEDYRTAIEDLVDYAKRNGIKIPQSSWELALPFRYLSISV